MITIFKVRQIIAEEAGLNINKVDDKSRFYEDLKFDSVRFEKLIVKIESKLGIELKREQVVRAATVEHLAYLVKVAEDQKAPVDDSILENEAF